ncbi:SubName: Full=Uncharacterized protein {ECO:0000313/EMBL:CCA75950.1} [Serendipita indica DSM 11827]|nr:SubName: Full=Uncharacterized protein {ECO:0000313/EMBL:CCA75950.1} [Serendipita indica DSM 11827]
MEQDPSQRVKPSTLHVGDTRTGQNVKNDSFEVETAKNSPPRRFDQSPDVEHPAQPQPILYDASDKCPHYSSIGVKSTHNNAASSEHPFPSSPAVPPPSRAPNGQSAPPLVNNSVNQPLYGEPLTQDYDPTKASVFGGQGQPTVDTASANGKPEIRQARLRDGFRKRIRLSPTLKKLKKLLNLLERLSWLSLSRGPDPAPSVASQTTVPDSGSSTTDSSSSATSTHSRHTTTQTQISIAGPPPNVDGSQDPQTWTTGMKDDGQPGSQPTSQGSEATPAEQGQTTTQPHPYYKRHPPPTFDLREDQIVQVRLHFNGNYSKVYEGTLNHNDVCIRVAVKIPKSYGNRHAGEGRAPASERRNLRELYAALDLRHQNIIEVYGICMKLGKYGALVMPWYDRNLRKHLKSKPSPAVRFQLWLDIICAVVYMHSRGFIHGDLKPENIMIDDHGNPKIGDFGLSYCIERAQMNEYQQLAVALNTTTTHVGTARYRAPELVGTNGGVRVTQAGDVYALGGIGLDILWSTMPYENRDNHDGIVLDIGAGLPPAQRPSNLSTQPLGLSRLWDALEWCWRPDSGDSGRPEAGQFHKHLLEHQGEIIAALGSRRN